MKISFVPPKEIQRLARLKSPDRLSVVSDALRLNVLSMVMEAGSGHLGSSFSSMEIMTTLWFSVLKRPNDPRSRHSDVFFSSKGHDVVSLYAILAATGRIPFQRLRRFRRLGGLPGHPDRETPFIATNTGSLGMGISKAAGLAYSKLLLGERGQVIVLTGDGELQEGQIWESLGPAVHQKLSQLTVIVDQNELQSDTWVSAVSPLGNVASKFASFGWEVLRVDGHDPRAIERVLRQRQRGPRVILARTMKGKGVSFMQHPKGTKDLYPFHSGAPRASDYERASLELQYKISRALSAQGARPLSLVSFPFKEPPSPAPVRLISSYGDALVDLARTNPKLLAMDADLVRDTGLVGFSQAFPKRYLQCGIAEQDMVSKAGALALSGWFPVVHSFAAFLTSRANEQIFNNATERTKILYVGSLAGVLPATPGHSHQGIRDVSALRAIPGMTLIEPLDAFEIRAALRWATRSARGPTYLRLTSVPVDPPKPRGSRKFRPGQGTVLASYGSGGVVVITSGPLLSRELVCASESAWKRRVASRIIHLPWLNRVDSRWLASQLTRASGILLVENHSLEGGLTEFLATEIQRLGWKAPVRRLGVQGIPPCGQPGEVLQALGLDSESLAREILSLGKHVKPRIKMRR